MKNILHPIASCLVLCVLFSDEALSNEDKRVVCFYRNVYSYIPPFDYTPDSIAASLCNDIVYDSAGINGETFELEYPGDTDREKIRQLTSLGARFSTDLNYFVSASDRRYSGRVFRDMMSESSKQASFIASVVRYMREFGFNGLNLDPWNPEENDKWAFVGLLQKLFDAFKRYGYLLTCTVDLEPIVGHYDNDTVSGFDLYRISEWVDWINVRAILRDHRSAEYLDAPSPLYRKSFEVGELKHLNVHDGLAIMEKLGAPRRKLVLGIPFFGNLFQQNTKSYHKVGDRLHYRDHGKQLSYGTDRYNAPTLCRHLLTGLWTKRFDHDGICPYIYQGLDWIGYEDEQSISIKMDFINNKGYGGAFTQSLNEDDFRGICGPKHALLKTLHRTLFKKEDTDAVETAETVLRKRMEAMGACPRCRCEL